MATNSDYVVSKQMKQWLELVPPPESAIRTKSYSVSYLERTGTDPYGHSWFDPNDDFLHHSQVDIFVLFRKIEKLLGGVP